MILEIDFFRYSALDIRINFNFTLLNLKAFLTLRYALRTNSRSAGT